MKLNCIHGNQVEKSHLTPLAVCPQWAHKTHCTCLSESIIRIYLQCQTCGIRTPQSISHLTFSPHDAKHLETWKHPNEWVNFSLFFWIFLEAYEQSNVGTSDCVIISGYKVTKSLKRPYASISKEQVECSLCNLFQYGIYIEHL